MADHPVAKEVLLRVGAGTIGGRVPSALEAAPYGWPRDAIDVALLGLLNDGHLKAERNGQPVRAAALTQQLIPKVRFLPEKVRLTTSERMAIRQLFQRLKVRARSGEEAAQAPEFLAKCRELAHATGGDPPWPPPPDMRLVEDLSGLTGSEQLAAIHHAREQIETSVALWKELGERARERTRAWELATALHCHADGDLDEVTGEIGHQLSAIRDQRTLLDDTDHVGPCVTRLADALRGALGELRDRLDAAVEAATERLAADATWQKLGTADQDAILHEVGLTPPRDLQVGTNEALRGELGARGLAAWRSEIDAVPTRKGRALAEPAKRLRVFTYVRLRRGTLGDVEAVRAWVAEHEGKLMTAVREGPVIVE